MDLAAREQVSEEIAPDLVGSKPMTFVFLARYDLTSVRHTSQAVQAGLAWSCDHARHSCQNLLSEVPWSEVYNVAPTKGTCLLASKTGLVVLFIAHDIPWSGDASVRVLPPASGTSQGEGMDE